MQSLDQFADEAEHIAEACAKEFSGKMPFVQAAAILELHSTFLSGFDSVELRQGMIEMHNAVVLSMAHLKYMARVHAQKPSH